MILLTHLPAKATRQPIVMHRSLPQHPNIAIWTCLRRMLPQTSPTTSTPRPPVLRTATPAPDPSVETSRRWLGGCPRVGWPGGESGESGQKLRPFQSLPGLPDLGVDDTAKELFFKSDTRNPWGWLGLDDVPAFLLSRKADNNHPLGWVYPTNH